MANLRCAARVNRRHEVAPIEQRLRDAGEASRIANSPLLSSKRFDHHRPRASLQTPDEAAESVEESCHATVRVGEICHPNASALPPEKWCDVRASQHDLFPIKGSDYLKHRFK